MSGEWQFTDYYDITPACPGCGYKHTCACKKKETPSLKQYTDITILLDRSGSMANIKEAMESAFDTFIAEHKAIPSTKLTLVEFDDIAPYNVVYQCVPIGGVEKLRLRPRGNTPLLDAFATTIDRTGDRLAAMSESERPDQVLIVVITDGQENASKVYTRSNVFNRVTKQREAYKWSFVYLGANQDTFAEAASFGIPQQWALNYTANTKGVLGSTRSLMNHTVAYASNSGKNRSKLSGFTKADRDLADDTLNVNK